MEGNTKVIKKKINYVRLITLWVIFSYVYIVLNYNFFISENLVNIVLYTFWVFFVGMFFMLDFKNLSKKLKLVYWLWILLIWIIFLIIWWLETF